MAIFTSLGIDAITRYEIGLSALFELSTLRLFVNAIVPTTETLLAQLTEATGFPGYAPITLIDTLWTGSTTLGVATYSYPQQTFNLTSYSGAPEIIFGYYVTFDPGGIIVFLEASATPFTVPYLGGQILITPQWIDENI